MHSTALSQALTLYQSGTLTLEQAAARAGRTEAAFAAAARRHGVSVPARAGRAEATPEADSDAERPANAD